MTDNITFSWSAFEHAHVPKESDWFWALGIITVAIACVAFFFANYLFGILALIAGGTVGLLAQRDNPLVAFEVSKDGIAIDGFLYEYDSFRQFSISERAYDTALIVIDTNNLLKPHLYIPLNEDIDPEALRTELKKHMHEIERGVPISHTIVEFFGL